MSFQHVSDEILSGYLSGELTAREKYDADSHFTICPECAARLEEQRSFEKKIAAAYNSSFPLYLSPDARCGVADEVRAGFVVDKQAPLWKKRIMLKLFTQVASIVIVAAVIALMVFSREEMNLPPVSPIQNTAAVAQTEKQVAPPAPAAKQNLSFTAKALVKSKTAQEKPGPEAVMLRTAKVNDRPVMNKPLPADTTAAPASVATQRLVAPVVSLKPHKSLVRIFQTDKILIRKNTDKNFVLQGVKSPFADNLYVIYAASGVQGENTSRKVELELIPAGDPEYDSFHPAGQKDVAVLIVRPRSQAPVTGILNAAITEDGEKRSSSLKFGSSVFASDFRTAPEQVRLAVILHAIGNPAYVLKRERRAVILAELEQLLAGGYAENLQIKTLLEQLKKVR